MTESSAASLIMYVGAPAILVIIFFIIAYSQKPDRLLTTKSSIVEPISFNRPKPNLLDQIKTRALLGRYRVVAESQSAIVFADRPSILMKTLSILAKLGSASDSSERLRELILDFPKYK